MYRGKSLIGVFAAVLTAAAFAAPVFAQGGDVEDFSVQSPAQMTSEGGADFSAALEAASKAEGRGAPAASATAQTSAAAAASAPNSETAAAGKADNAAAPKAKEKEKKPKAEGSGEKLKNNMGARFGVGRDMDISIGFGIGLSSSNRIVTGLNAGWGVSDEHSFQTFEAFGFWDWNVNLSDDGALRWFFGPGVTFGVQRAEMDNLKDVSDTSKNHKGVLWTDEHGNTKQVDTVFITKSVENNPKMSDAGKSINVGIGARTGLEVDLSFIDPDHALSMLRSSSVSLDVRLLLYLFLKDGKGEAQEYYPSIMPSLGITYNYVFGGGKDKK